MYTISECIACVILALTVSTLLCGLCIVLFTIKWGIERLRHISANTTVRTFSHDQPLVMRGVMDRCQLSEATVAEYRGRDSFRVRL
jgi:hypothetical protein